jgi:metallo-beta-lactamase family protein
VKLQFLGANRQVTGSRYFLDLGHARIMIDCGLFQERKYEHRNWDPAPVDVSSMDAVLLTHAHIDHCGLLPRMYANGCRAPIFTTNPTVDLADILLRDAAKIQLEDVKYKQKRHKREHRKSKYPYEPLYNIDQAVATIGHFHGVDYYTSTEIVKGVTVTFHDAGHILGSSSVELRCAVSGREPVRIVFSGDIGQWDKPIIRDPSPLAAADFVVIESTYGDRMHKDAGDIATQFAQVINDTVRRGGKVVIPTFAVERAQEITFHLAQLVRQNRIPDIPVFLDSPMAADVTDVFREHRNVFDSETWQMIVEGDPPLVFPALMMSRTTAQSKAINDVEGPAIIMSTSGMCTAGRIKHHLRNNIEDSRATILFVGYQGAGTLGRLIVDGKEKVRIHGKYLQVKAKIARIYGFSGHADRAALLRWSRAFRQPPKRAFITHGEEKQALSLAAALRETDWDAHVPQYREAVELD